MSNTHLVCKQACNKVSITVVSNDQVRVGLKLTSNLMCNILASVRKTMINKMSIYKKAIKRGANLGIYIGESLQIRPDFETRDPFANNSILSSEWHTKDLAVLSAKDLLKTLATGGASCVREQPGDL